MTPRSDSDRGGSVATLERIADTLGIPVDALLTAGEPTSASTRQVADLVAAFLAIGDPAGRELCITFVQTVAGLRPVTAPFPDLSGA